MGAPPLADASRETGGEDDGTLHLAAVAGPAELVRLILRAKPLLLEVLAALEGTSEDAAGLVRPRVERWLDDFDRLDPVD